MGLFSLPFKILGLTAWTIIVSLFSIAAIIALLWWNGLFEFAELLKILGV